MLNKKRLAFVFGFVALLGCVESKKTNTNNVVEVGIADSLSNTAWMKKANGTLHTITLPDNAEGDLETVDLSPNKKFVMLTAALGDFGQVWVYNIKESDLHEIEGGFGLGDMGWLDDSRVMLHQGCVTASYCKKLESINNETPWLMKVTEDLGKNN